MTEGRDERIRLRGSEREVAPGARRVGAVDPTAAVEVTVLVRRGAASGAPARDPAAAESVGTGVEARRARRQALADRTRASAADLDRVTTFAEAHDLIVVEVDAARRTVRLSGTAEDMARAFGVRLARYELGSGDSATTFRGREGYVHLPPELADIVEAVLGLDDRPQARFGLRLGRTLAPGEVPDPTAAPVADTPFWAPQVASLYDFPEGTGGAGEAVAIIELGGGYTEVDIASYFGQLGLTPPTVVAVGVDGGANTPGDDADAEVVLDIEVAGAVAPRSTVVVYFAPNTDAGFLDAVTTAVHDEEYAPSVISISWGAPEAQWTAQAMTAMDSAFADAAVAGVTVLCAAGDHGAGDAAGDALAHADFPSSSPNAVACGGTTLRAAAGAVVDEVVWNDGDGWATGGGVSDVFDLPAWQASAEVPPSVNGDRRGRGVPDVAGNADGGTGYIVVLNGKNSVVGGTSAVAPLYAGLTALLNAELGEPVADLLPLLYGPAGGAAFRDITSGDNSVPRSDFGPAVAGYPARTGWDACTGWGSIDGTALLAALRDATVSPATRRTA
jgi:kumamolisin